jgi:hypothetical protein
MSTELFGLYRAVVGSADDPEGRQRLRLEIPSLDLGPLDWAEACITSELPCRPVVGDTVWVMFEAGDPRHPVWLGVHPSRA